jgi:hypothetical protein
VATSVNLLCDMFKQIILETAKSGVPLGISIEHVSIFREVSAFSFVDHAGSLPGDAEVICPKLTICLGVTMGVWPCLCRR